MFNLKNLASKVSNITQKPIKVVASNNFLNAINQINQISDAKENEKDDNYNNLLSEAVILLKYFSSGIDFDPELFYEIAKILTDANTLKPNKAEPYFYLSWLYQYAGETETAIKYLKVVSSLNPSINGLEELRELISSNIVIYRENDDIKTEKKDVIKKDIENQSNISTKPPPKLNPIIGRKTSAYQQYK